MSDIRQTRNTGILRDGWTGSVEDYALSCNWSQDGNVLMVCDVMGGIKAFHGKSGEIFWACSDTHDSGLLATSMHPEGILFATSGQDGNIMIWSVEEGTPKTQIYLGSGWAEKLLSDL